MDFEIKTEGFKELMEQLDTFCTPGVQRKLLQNSVKEGARPVRDDAERRLGKGRGYIAVGTPKRIGWGGDTVAAIGIGLKAKHWALVFREYGTIERYTGKQRKGKATAKKAYRG